MNRVCAVVVTFHPPPALAGNLVALQTQVAGQVIVDNGTLSRWPASLRAAVERPGVTLIANPDNRGIAAAFNQGLQYALNQGFEWAATFDQDSRPPPQFISGLWDAWQACPFREQVAVVAPRYWLKATPISASAAPARPAWRPITVAMASGNLVRLQAAQSVGWMDESFFIDYVDFDFCLRLRRQGWRIIEAQDTWLPHSLGSRQKHRWLGMEFSLVSHSPLRRYYNARNRWVTYRRHALKFPGWFFQDFTWWLIETGKILMCEDRKGAKLRAMRAGIRDARQRRMGPAQPSLVACLQPAGPPSQS